MDIQVFSDESFMKEALKEAQKAYEKEEVPVGAVVVCQNQIIARCHNLTEQLNDVTAHAEMQAITSAANYLGGKYLTECVIYVTLEPCIMCGGALFWSKLGKLVYGASDPKNGFTSSEKKLIHPKTRIVGGILQEESLNLLRSFFKSKRK